MHSLSSNSKSYNFNFKSSMIPTVSPTKYHLVFFIWTRLRSLHGLLGIVEWYLSWHPPDLLVVWQHKASLGLLSTWKQCQDILIVGWWWRTNMLANVDCLLNESGSSQDVVHNPLCWGDAEEIYQPELALQIIGMIKMYPFYDRNQ